MKSNLLLGILFFPLMYYAQVGVNTAAPAASLDITAKNPTGAATNVDGLLIPRVDHQRAQSMTGVPVSTLIYVNSIATGTQSGSAVNVDTVGYYYYNGTAWTKLNPAVTPASSFNIYNTDGSLSSNRVVTQGGNTLSFTGTAANAFSVDGTTLSVDAANDRVGIGSIAPTRKLHVEGSQFLNAAATASATKEALDINVGHDGIGYGNRADNYGISMRTASSAAGGLISRINFGDTSTVNADGTRYLSFSVGQTPNELMYLTDANSGRVGIGTLTPQKTLHVNGSLQFTNELNVGGTATTAGSAGTAGQVLKSNGPGVAPSWQEVISPADSVVRLSGVAIRSGLQTASTAGTWTTIMYNSTPKMDPSVVSYNSGTGIFTVLKAGYYQLISYSSFDMSANASGETSGTGQTRIRKNTISISLSSSGYSERTNEVNHTTAGLDYFNVGDTFSIQMVMTRPFRISKSSLSITYLGE
ncbi:hypothetical protein ODZ84_07590 [Chryseobacterium fluminis]|uniref:hypothetical protein n=1 Tax=Chryseobacterium fluminis TaxID=2983606 RepID=UPI002252DA0C|nr:hypothetical protein [Chryseobacterium sp. MMS21-Ot14]UZT99415.1 hypothetical protein ODZ84_07590 [Chryseobacterium sp. MMS21-Ot14]